VPCHSGVGLTPRVDGRVHHFSAGGVHNGLFLMVDDETRTYWDHISGKALHGPLEGEALDSWPLRMSSAEEALARNPDLVLLRSSPGALGRIMGWFTTRGLRGRGAISPFVALGARKIDGRLPKMENGLGVVEGTEARFYRLADARRGLVDALAGRTLEVSTGADGIPQAVYKDGGGRPMQLFTRWYGFCCSWPGCGIYDAGKEGNDA
jgi:hypothetical protein